MPIFGEGDSIPFGRGNKLFELSNHLGNVLVTVNDKKLGISSNNTTVDYFNPQVMSAQDYYPFGMLQPGRNYNAGGYRFGFNGQERSDDIKGLGNSYTAQYWEYDSRIGRRWNLDPRPIISISSYSGLANNPVRFGDPLGDTLDVGSNGNTNTDLLSIVDERNRRYINISVTGAVTIDRSFNELDKIDQGAIKINDKGFRLISDLVSQSQKWYYMTTNRRRFTLTDPAGNEIGREDYNIGDNYPAGSRLSGELVNGRRALFNSFLNLSNTPRGDEAAMGGGQKPNFVGFNSRRYDGEVYISPGEFYQTQFGVGVLIPRKSIIFHELKENYNRVMGDSYEAGHKAAKQTEGASLGNLHPGTVDYFIMGTVTRNPPR